MVVQWFTPKKRKKTGATTRDNSRSDRLTSTTDQLPRSTLVASLQWWTIARKAEVMPETRRSGGEPSGEFLGRFWGLGFVLDFVDCSTVSLLEKRVYPSPKYPFADVLVGFLLICAVVFLGFSCV